MRKAMLIPAAAAAAAAAVAVALCVLAGPGAAFSGSRDGWFRAFDANDGRLIREIDTARAYETVNGVPATGAWSVARATCCWRSAPTANNVPSALQ
jgi:hypothetical protein